MIEQIRQWIRKTEHQQGQGLVEYSLVLALVAMVVIVILAVLGPSIRVTYHRVYSEMICAQHQSNRVAMFEARGFSHNSRELAFMRWNEKCISIDADNYNLRFQQMIIEGGNPPGTIP